jgi:hypothetical protein
MRRQVFQSTAILFLICLGTTFAPRPASAQTNTGLGLGNIVSDPFTFYYAYYLPNQQIQALRPKPIDEINQVVQNRQYYAQTQRSSLYNPISPYTEGGADYDPLRPYSPQQGRERMAQPFRFRQRPSNADGSGPSLYYNRAAQYFPGLRPGRGANQNVARTKARHGGVGGGGGAGGLGGLGGMGGFGGFG